MEYRAALLASHGYVSLALEYLSAEEISSASEEVQYFEVRPAGWYFQDSHFLNLSCLMKRVHTAESNTLESRSVLLSLNSSLKS